LAALGEIARARARWRALWRSLGARVVPERAFEELVASYEEAHRAYHRFDHVIDCLRVFDTVASAADRPAEVEAAIWFHDVVYDPKRDDNESRSANLAAHVLRDAGVDEAAARRILELVLATRHEVPPKTQDERLVLDVDLSILGRSPPEFLAFEEQIRSEYQWVPADVFHERRAAVLERFSRREPLFYTAELRSRFESQARANLATALRSHRRRARPPSGDSARMRGPEET
jgi:predicted metal-dependent HD superfamily phosphohydrolase